MFHLPQAHDAQDDSLRKRPVENTLVGAFAGLPEAFLSVSLVVLLLGDLLDLVQKLTDSKLQFGEFLLLCDIRVIDSVFTDLNVKMDSELRAAEPRS